MSNLDRLMQKAIDGMKKKATQFRSEANGLVKKANQIEETAKGLMAIMGGTDTEEPQAGPRPKRRRRRKAREFPFGKPVSKGGKMTNSEVITSFLKRPMTSAAKTKQIAKSTGIPVGSVSAILCTDKNKFVQVGDSKWSLKK